MKEKDEDLLVQLALLGAVYASGGETDEDSMKKIADGLYSYAKVKNLGVRGLADHMVLNGFPVETAIELFNSHRIDWDTVAN